MGPPAQVGDSVSYVGNAYRVEERLGYGWFVLADAEGETIVRHIPGLRQDTFLTAVSDAICGS
jgi:hypothetical protein